MKSTGQKVVCCSGYIKTESFWTKAMLRKNDKWEYGDDVTLKTLATNKFQADSKAEGKTNKYFLRGVVWLSRKIKNVIKKIYNKTIKAFIRTFSLVLRENHFKYKVNEIDGRFDVVISHDSFALLAGYIVARKNGAKLIYDAVEIPEVKERTGTYFRDLPQIACATLRWRYKRIIKKADHVLTVSSSLKNWIENAFNRDDVLIVENARKKSIEKKSSAIRRDLGLENDEKLILCVSTLIPGMGVENLLDELLAMPSNLHFASIGVIDKRYEQNLRRRYDSSRLHFIGLKQYEELPQYMSGADVGVINLPHDALNMKMALPNRFFDYVAAKLPIVTTSLPSVNYYILEYGNGIVINESFSWAVSEILNDPDKYTEACNKAAKELKWSNQEKRLLSLLDENDKKIALLANKSIHNNGRISRMVDSLVDAGLDVTVFANSLHSCPSPACSYVKLDSFQDYVKSFYWT